MEMKKKVFEFLSRKVSKLNQQLLNQTIRDVPIRTVLERFGMQQLELFWAVELVQCTDHCER